jgi:hypothetical protein
MKSFGLWRRVAGGKIGRMTKEQALAKIQEINAEHPGPGATIHHPAIRELTGGFNSQAINGYVLRKLGVKAGIIKNRS